MVLAFFFAAFLVVAFVAVPLTVLEAGFSFFRFAAQRAF
jgi:hypothetical protein